jgi:hypothetical protein
MSAAIRRNTWKVPARNPPCSEEKFRRGVRTDDDGLKIYHCPSGSLRHLSLGVAEDLQQRGKDSVCSDLHFTNTVVHAAVSCARGWEWPELIPTLD